MSDAAGSPNAGAAGEKRVSSGIEGKCRETRLMGREGTSWPLKEVVCQELSFKLTFLWSVSWQFLWTQRTSRLFECKGKRRRASGKTEWMERVSRDAEMQR